MHVVRVAHLVHQVLGPDQAGFLGEVLFHEPPVGVVPFDDVHAFALDQAQRFVVLGDVRANGEHDIVVFGFCGRGEMRVTDERRRIVVARLVLTFDGQLFGDAERCLFCNDKCGL